MSGVSIKVNGITATVTRVRGIEVKADTKVRRMLAVAGVETGEILKGLLNVPRKRDPFWGVVGGVSQTGLALRSGTTRRSIIANGRVYESPNGYLYTVVASSAEHMVLLEEGGPLVGNPWLRIPTAVMQTPAGVDRLAGQSARRLRDGFVWPTRRMKNFKNGRPKNIWIARRGADGRLVLCYLLKRSVTIKGHHSFAEARRIALPKFEALGQTMAAEIVAEA